MPGFMEGGGDGGFYGEMGRRRVQARPQAPRPMGGTPMSGGAPRPTAPRPPMSGGMGPAPRPSPVISGGTPMSGAGGSMGGAPQFTPGTNFGSTGTMGAGWTPGLMDGPSQMMFSSLPQGTEEAFGFAPGGFNESLRRGGYKGPLASPGGGMF
jgi:hypothetical protein